MTPEPDNDRPAKIVVDLGAVERNLARIRERLPAGTGVIASVKANGYGHGAVDVAQRLGQGGVELVGTASVAEARAIRDGGAHKRVLVFGGFRPEAAPGIARHGLIPTVANAETAHALAEGAAPGCGVFVKVDCGLGRLGVPVADAFLFVRRLSTEFGLVVEGLYTHLPFQTAEGERWARAKLSAFTQLVDQLRDADAEPPVTQALSSPGLSAGLPNPFTAVCPGRLIYGLAPSVGTAMSWGLEPALRSVTTQITHLSRHGAGARIGSGGGVVLRRPTLVGVVPFGQANGYGCPSARAVDVLHHGQRRSVLGVSLEHAAIDLGDGPAEIGDEIVVLGRSGAEELTLAGLAAARGMTTLDLLTSLDRRTPYEYVT